MSNKPEHRPISNERILEHWDDFTADEVDWVDGDAQRLIEALETKYGLSGDEAARQVAAFLEKNETKAQIRG
ncbi:hypothetical protein [Planctomicrobium piriforme]|uniref:General stress protein CsbD n=1 Tax=Planctomicrobium piriforme TaxID=1576369 RepID=A0A1I3E2R7_9PLAN|nr:hypothetical protein [Planctomicrobium piriforme]SFH93255.1 hypothetical protein SAMN05421753_10455 [Planctomicrobium piriforme]